MQSATALKKASVLIEGYTKADSRNLPRVDVLMVVDFFNSSSDHIQPGCQHRKLER